MSVNPAIKCRSSPTIASTHPTRVIRAIVVTTVTVAIIATVAIIVTTAIIAITATVVIAAIPAIAATTVTIAIAAIPAMGTTITITTT